MIENLNSFNSVLYLFMRKINCKFTKYKIKIIMKTLKQILKSKPVFINDWEKDTDVFRDFEIDESKDIKVLFASYTYEDYSGDAFVLYSINNELFEANGSHCSCYGLEGQWSAEQIVLKELENRLTKGTFGQYGFEQALKEFLSID